MPGGLASWLDDESTSRKSKLPFRATGGHIHSKSTPREASQLSSAIDVDAASPSPGATGARGARDNLLPTSAGKPAWDPFSSNNTRVNAREDAFARLRQGAAAAKQQPAASTAAAASTPSPPTWRRESPPTSSSWDPFAGKADGKENSGNAFSKLLAAPCQQHSSHKGRSLVAGGSGKKRTRLGAPAAAAAAAAAAAGGLGGTASEAEAATRFCECPVCGKRVIIELCSKHLDTECGGPDTDAVSPPAPARDKSRPAEPLPPARFTSAASLVTASDTPSPRQQPPSGIPARSCGSPVDGRKGTSKDSRVASPSAPAVPATDVSDEPINAADSSNGATEVESAAVKRVGSPLASAAVTAAPAAAAAAASAAVKPAVSRRKRTARGAPPSPRQGAKRNAAATGMTTCPVCGKHVRADRCSWHLDHECAGANSSPAALPSCEGKSTRGAGDDKETGGGAEKGGGADDGGGAPKNDVGSEVAGGMNALVAELTCPVCLCVFEDVHSLPCSHRFCLECILGCFKSSKRQECPLCKIPAWKRDLTRDVPLHNIIIAYRRMAAK